MLQVVRTELSAEGVTAQELSNFWNEVKNMDKEMRDEYKLKVQLKSTDSKDPTITPTKDLSESIKVDVSTPVMSTPSGNTGPKLGFSMNIDENEEGEVQPDFNPQAERNKDGDNPERES